MKPSMLILMACIALWGGPLQAAEGEARDSENPREQTIGEEAATEQSEQAQVQTEGENAGDITPTEEISEDLSVPFPVDI